LSSGYITNKTKRTQPEDGVKKWPKHVFVKHIVQHSTINFVVFRLIVTYFVFSLYNTTGMLHLKVVFTILKI